LPKSEADLLESETVETFSLPYALRFAPPALTAVISSFPFSFRLGRLAECFS